MKILSILFLTIFLGNGCDSAKAQDMENAIIEYTANTRGFYQKIIVKNKTVTISKDRDGQGQATPIKINEADWKEIITYFDTVEIEQLSKFKAPSEKRFHDGAAIANLKVTYKGKTYETTDFDHGFPPKEIQQFVAKINSFVTEE
ncbi:hypothetical protein ACNQGB_15010 [Flavobacterium sp. XS1P32]|uniref:hypothetical protein n=1 Tax=Flavobacterium sp. XS1P32 TaxID=3401726 RepID=UPI003AAD8B25